MLRSAIARHALSRTLESQTIRRIDRRREVVPSRVVARNLDGLASLVALDGECPVRSTEVGSESVGDIVTVPAAFARQRGVTSAGSTRDAVSGSLWLESQSPQDLPRGETTAVAYVGRGFATGLVIVYLLPSQLWADPTVPEVHPDVDVANLVIVDSENATADVTLTIDAQGYWDVETGQEALLPIKYYKE